MESSLFASAASVFLEKNLEKPSIREIPSNIIQPMGAGPCFGPTNKMAGVHRFRGVLRAGLVANLGGDDMARMVPRGDVKTDGPGEIFEEMIQ